MKIRNLIMALCFTLAFGTAVADKHTPPPPKDERVCTIGWYKNNGFDTWYPTCLAEDGAAVCDGLVADMNATGAHAGDTKNAAADYIVANYVSEESCEAVTGEID
jgi:hypothetical protein